LDELKVNWGKLSRLEQAHPEVLALKNELKNALL
jgi:hypothetical protein